MIHTIQEAVAYLQTYVPKMPELRKNYTLDRMVAVLAHLGDPQNKLRVVHVAGTSGKTSTAYFIRALLQQAGKRTGLTVSPHIVSITERLQLDGLPLADEDFVAQLNKFLPLLEDFDAPLTYFEVLVAFVYWVLAEEKVDYAIVETGLGGQVDGTNTVYRRDKLCVITDIGFDHMEVLGWTLPEIAGQKAGIIQPGNHVVMHIQPPEIMQIVRQRAATQGAVLEVLEPYLPQGSDLPLFQQRNWSLALAAYHYLAAQDGLPVLADRQLALAAHSQPPGRMEIMAVGGKTIILDGAHNAQKLAALRAALQQRDIRGAVVVANFIQKAGDLSHSLQELLPFTAELHVPEFSLGQDVVKVSQPSALVARRARQSGLAATAHNTVHAAVRAALHSPHQVVVVTGSLYLVSLVRAELQLMR